MCLSKGVTKALWTLVSDPLRTEPGSPNPGAPSWRFHKTSYLQRSVHALGWKSLIKSPGVELSRWCNFPLQPPLMEPSGSPPRNHSVLNGAVCQGLAWVLRVNGKGREFLRHEPWSVSSNTFPWNQQPKSTAFFRSLTGGLSNLSGA